MLAYTYIEKGKFELIEKDKPVLQDSRDAIVRVTLSSICTSDLHIKHGSVPRAVPGITVGHEMVGIVESVGTDVKTVKPGDRVTVNVETYCGECFFCKRGFVNNCTDKNGGWALGCRIDGGQAEYVRVPYADQGLDIIPENVSDEQALFVGDVLATGFWAARISEIIEDDTVLIIGAGPTGICTLLCAKLHNPKRIIVCESDAYRREFVKSHYTDVLVTSPENVAEFVKENSDHGGADVVLEVAGAKETFRMAWECARPNAIVTVVALYDEAQTLPLPDMYGKNLIFKTGGVDGCDCREILDLIAEGKIDTTPLITHTFSLAEIDAAYELFENRRDNVIKVAIKNRKVRWQTMQVSEFGKEFHAVLGTNYKTKDVDNFNKRFIRENIDVSFLRPVLHEHEEYYRTYFQVTIMQLATKEEKMAFVEDNFDLLHDWWHADGIVSFLGDSLDFDYAVSKAKEYIKSELPYVRRLGYVLFIPRLVRDASKIESLFGLFKNDEEYHVIMGEAWLISYLAMCDADRTYAYLQNCDLKYNIVGKAIQKICDSYVVSGEDKERFKGLRESRRNLK